MNSKLKYLGKNTALFAISSFATKILSFFLVPLYTSTLTTSEYGTADLITTTATLLVFVLTINIADSVTRFTLDVQNGVDRNKVVEGKKIVKHSTGAVSARMEQQAILSYGNRIITIATLVCTLVLGILCWSGLVAWPAYYYIFLLLYFFSSAFYQMMANYLRGTDKVSSVAIAGVIAGFSSIACNVIFLLGLKWGIIGYLLAMVMGPLIASGYCVVVAGAPLKTYLVNTCSDLMRREMRRYCVPLIFNNVALWINAFLDRYFVTAICGVDQNGVYSVASKIPTILSTGYSIFGQAWNLSAIKEFDPEDKDGFFGKTYSVYNATMVILCSVIILFNVPLARFLYAKDFFEAWRYSSVLLISIMFNALTMFVGSVFAAVKKTKVIAWTTVISAICNTILNSLLIPVMGPLGAAIATAAAYGVMWTVRMIYSRRFIHFKTNLVRDCLMYGVVCLQVICEHLQGHFYIGQVGCLMILIIVYRKTIWTILDRVVVKRFNN